jgi:hypothetical protein
MLTRLRRHVTYANITATIALFAALGGVSYAALHVGSRQIANNSVRSKDIRNNDVRSRDLRTGEVRTSDIATKARGVAIAGADVGSNGSVVKWFNREGGKPTVEHLTGSGEYTVSFPGIQTERALISLSSGTGFVSGGSTGGPGSNLVFVAGYAADGVDSHADEQFYLVLHSASASG